MTKIIFILTMLSSAMAYSLPSKYVVVPNRSDSTIALVSSPQGKV